MQRTESGFIIISCDFCATDWDEVKPMVEGHHGSVLCLQCLEQALRAAQPQPGSYACTLCLRTDLPPSLPRWSNPARPAAIVCQDCLEQAARAFERDPDTHWNRPENV